MPFTRITLRQGYSDDQIASISSILQKSLEDEFLVPEHDVFQVFEELPTRQRVYNPHYKSGGRSKDFIQFHIIAGKPRTNEQKQNLCYVLCQSLHSALGISPDDVMVIIQFNTTSEWSFSQGRIESIID